MKSSYPKHVWLAVATGIIQREWAKYSRRINMDQQPVWILGVAYFRDIGGRWQSKLWWRRNGSIAGYMGIERDGPIELYGGAL